MTLDQLIRTMPDFVTKWTLGWTERPGRRCDAVVWFGHQMHTAQGETAFEALDNAVKSACETFRK